MLAIYSINPSSYLLNMPTLAKLLELNMERPVTTAEVNEWRRKRANLRRRCQNRFNKGEFSNEELQQRYVQINATGIESIDNLAWPTGGQANRLRTVLEQNEGRPVTDEEYEKWKKARKWRVTRIYELAKSGLYTQEKRASMLLAVDQSNTETINSIRVLSPCK